MTGQEKQPFRDTSRADKVTADELEQLSKDQARRKINLAREQAIEKDLKARETRESEKRAIEERGQLAKDQARRKADLAREQAIEKELESRRLKAKNQSRE